MNMKAKLLEMKVSGNIVSELSNRIPSNFMALNELIKNAFDADAPSIDINILTKEKKIVIHDTGIGMDRTGMENLLYIARSNKDYAILRENGRITQGEKGLGALAAFHFGNAVTWETSQDGRVAHKFTVLKDEIIDTDNISEYKISIEKTLGSFKGTKITISKVSDDVFTFMIETLEDKKVTTKLIRSLYDSVSFARFEVTIRIDEKTVVDERDLKTEETNNKEQIYSVKYDSSKSKIIYFYYKDTPVMEVPFNLDPKLNEFNVKCNLNIYDLGGKVSNSDFPALYHKEQKKPDITPLVYINQGFFKNYILFDVDIVRRTKSTESLPQITGEIEIKTQNDSLKFNADRTEINENILTAKLKTEIERLNILIQKTGSKYKRPFIDMNRNKSPTIVKCEKIYITSSNSNNIEALVKNNILNDVFSKLTTFVIDSDKATYTFFERKIIVKLLKNQLPPNSIIKKKSATEEETSENKSESFKPAIIKLSQNKIEKLIGSSGQIDLYSFIVVEKTLDSTDNRIPYESIKIKDNQGLMKSVHILPAVDSPQNVEITYTYFDENTGNTSASLKIVFDFPPKIPMKGKASEESLIHTHGIGNFEATFDTVAAKLVNQINSLKYDDYVEMISCSLRTLFEMGVDSIKNINTESTVLKSLQSTIASGGLDENVKKIVAFVEKGGNGTNIVGYLKKSCSNVSFHTLANIANPDIISKYASESNLGAHKGTTNLTKQQIVAIANGVNAYLIFVEGIIGAYR